MDVRTLRDKLLAERDLDIDFLRPETVERVVTAHIERAGVKNVDELVRHIDGGPERMQSLAEELVTPPEGFFADPDLVSLLRDRVIPQLVSAKHAAGTIRVWVLNCRQGYVAYDVALLLSSALGDAQRKAKVRMFATDTDSHNIEIARSQDYPRERFADLVRRGVKLADRGGRPALPDEIRAMMLFGVHDPIGQPPYRAQNLIVCLGYLPLLPADARQRVVTNLVQGLAVGGVLISGRGEMLGFDAEPPRASRPFSMLHRRIPHALDLSLEARRGETAPEQIREFADRLQVPVMLVDLNGEVVAANSPAREALDAEGLAGRRLSEAPAGSVFRDIAARVRAAAKLDSPQVLRCKNGWRAGIVLVQRETDGARLAVVVLLGSGEAEAERTEKTDLVLGAAALQIADVVAQKWEHDRQMSQLKTQSTLMTQSLYKRTEDLNKVRDRLESVNAEFRIANRRLRQALEERERAQAQLQAAYDREHHIADTLQRSLLASFADHYDGYSVAARYRPAFAEAEVGGDFYHVGKLHDGRLFLILGDVSGKGLEAAVFAYMVKYMTLGFITENPSPASVLSRVNDAVANYTQSGWFVTMVYMLLDLESNRLLFGSGGHEPVAYQHAATDMAELLFPTGPAIGIAPGADYRERSVDMQPGDVLVVYTDGISDAGPSTEPLRPEGVSEIVRLHASGGLSEVLDAMYDAATHRAGGRLRDDASSLCIKREVAGDR